MILVVFSRRMMLNHIQNEHCWIISWLRTEFWQRLICWDVSSGPVDVWSHFLHICTFCLFSCLIYVSVRVPFSFLSRLCLRSCFCPFYRCCPLPQFCPLWSHYSYFPSLHGSSSFPPLIFASPAARCRNLGTVSSGQSHPSTQYESGLQQGGQQGEQPGHQPRPLLHTPRWVAGGTAEKKWGAGQPFFADI